MKIFVCLKQVPDTETKIKFNGDLSGIDATGVKWVVNPYDEYAIEEAVKLKEANAGSQVFAITLGPKARASESLRTALAMGCDEGIVVNAPENLDVFATAKALAAAIKAEGGADLIFAGKMAIDDNSSAVPQMIAEFLNIPHTSVVSKFQNSPENVVVERDADGGSKEVVQMMKPALVAANKGLNMPRYASLPGIMKAKKKALKEVELAALGVTDADIKVKMVNFSFPPDKAGVKMISGDASAQSTELVKLLRDEAKIL